MKDRKLTQETFDELIARAMEIDDAGHQPIDLERARQIARELDISDEAWQAALLERQAALRSQSDAEMTPEVRSNVLWSLTLAALGAAAGAAMVVSPFHDVIGGAAIVAGALGYVTWRRDRPVSSTLLQLVAFWTTVPIAIDIAAGELWTDPFWFAGWSLLGSSVAAIGLPRVLRRLRGTAPPSRQPPDVVGLAES